MVNRYNTGNSVPSNTMMDLSDNAQILDQFTNSPDGMVSLRTGKAVPVLQAQVAARIDDLTADAQAAIATSRANAESTAADKSTMQNLAEVVTTAGAAIKVFTTTLDDPEGTITGLAATTDGQSFYVAQGTDSAVAMILYKNNSGSALAVADAVGKAAIDSVSEDIKSIALNNGQAIEGYDDIAEMTVDSKGGVTARRLADGTSQFPAIMVGDKVEMVQTSDGFVIQNRDNGDSLFSLSHDSTMTMLGQTVLLSDEYPDCLEIYADSKGRIYKRVLLDGTVENVTTGATEDPANALTTPLTYSDGSNIFSIAGNTVSQITADTGKANISPLAYSTFARFISNHSGANRVQRATYNGLGRIDESTGKLIHILITGQSLSVGGATITQSPVTTAPDNDYGIVCFNGGPKIDFKYQTLADSDLVSLVPLQENIGERPGQESPSSGIGYQVNKVTGHSVLLSTAGSSGTTIANISSGTATFAGAQAMLQAGYNIATALGLAYQPYLVFIHGNQDAAASTANATYKAAIKSLLNSYQAIVQSITGTDDTLNMFIGQMANTRPYAQSTGTTIHNSMGLAQWNGTLEDKRIMLASTEYARPYVDTDHISSVGYRTEGEVIGISVGNYIVSQKIPGLRPDVANIVQSGTTITLPLLGCVGALVIDTLRVTDPGNYGFYLAGATISSVAVSGSDDSAVITITKIDSTTATSIEYATYGVSGNMPGPTTGSRGCIHDSQTGTSKSGLPLYNDLVVFNYTF